MLQQAVQTSVRERQPARPITVRPSLKAGPGPISPAKIEAKGRNRERCHARYLEVMERVHRGYSNNKIARELGLDRSTVLRWRLAGQFPERQDPPRSRQVDTFSVYLQQRWDEGCRNGMELWAELRQQRFTGGLDLVRIWIRRRYGLQSRRTYERRPRQRRASASQWLWLLLNEPARHRPLLADLYRQIPELAANAQAAREFFRIVRHRDIAAWPRWLEQARHTALAGFALSVQRDEAAVMAALRLPGVTDQSKATSTGSKCSSARCTVVLASTCWACASSTPTKLHPTGCIPHSEQSFTKCAHEPGTQ